MRALEAAAGADWFMTEAALEQIVQIAAREHQPDFEAVAAKQQKRLDEASTIRGSVATVNVTGPIFRYANLFTAVSGATSISSIASAFQAAVDNPQVSHIVLNVDSPGGEVAGVSELAAMIKASPKPVTAYVDGMAASGSYWIASAAKRIVAAETGQVGSIGVVATMTKYPDQSGVKRYEFVSSQSPNKRLNLETDSGRAAIQQRIDDLAGVFVANVAANRGVSVEAVLEKFGRGDVMIAGRAKEVGMIDQIGTYEALVDKLNKAHAGPISFGGTNVSEESKVKAPEVDAAAIAAKAKAEGITEGRALERARILSILALDEAKGREDLARTIACETETSLEVAKKMLATAPKAQAGNPLAEAMAKVQNPKVGADKTSSMETMSEADLVKQTLAVSGHAKEVN